MNNSGLHGSIYEKFIFVMYVLFVAGYFYFPQAPEHYKFYYFFLMGPSVFLWAAFVKEQRANLLFILMALYIGYMVSSALWSPGFDGAAFGKVVWHGFLVLSFVVISGIIRTRYPEQLDTVFRGLVFVAALAGLVSILLWYADHPFPTSRMKPAGRLEWEIRAAGIYGFFWILSMFFFLETKSKIRWAYIVAGVVLLLTVLLTQTRTVFVALTAAGLILLARRDYRMLLAFFVIGVLAVVFLPGLFDRIAERGLSYRPSIWVEAFEQAKVNWLFGSGYLSDRQVFADGMYFPHAHNMFIATFRDGGVIGLALLCSILVVSTLWAFRLSKYIGHNFHLVLLVYLLLYAMPNPDRLLTRPREQWIFIWLPLIWIMADCYRLRLAKMILTDKVQSRARSYPMEGEQTG